MYVVPEFLRVERQGHRDDTVAFQALGTVEQPITCTLCPRVNGAGYVFEISPQLGCVMGCIFCACGEFRGNFSPREEVEQIAILQSDADAYRVDIGRPKISFSDGGELVLNPHCPEILQAVTRHLPADVKISSILPDTPLTRRNLDFILSFANSYSNDSHNVGFQISLASTLPVIRDRERIGRIPVFSFADIREFGRQWLGHHTDADRHRKITLSFTLTNASHCDPKEIVDELPPSLFAVRVHPYRDNGTGLMTISAEKCRSIQDDFSGRGYTVIQEPLDDEAYNNRLIEGGTNALRNRIRSIGRLTSYERVIEISRLQTEQRLLDWDETDRRGR